jgi:5-methylcytosine-specific restriction endonuclease McrA
MIPLEALQYLTSHIRNAWRYYSPERKQISKIQECRICQCIGKMKVDHINPVGKGPRTLEEVIPYIKRMFCPIENLQPICDQCHDAKTAEEKRKGAYK